MKVGVAGLWHLGCVTAACLAKGGHEVVAYDSLRTTVDNLLAGQPPIFEPQLAETLAVGVKENRLQFTHNPAALADRDVIWVCFDTPVDTEDGADVSSVLHEVRRILPFVKNRALILISSQLPVGTTEKLLAETELNYTLKKIVFAVSPENLRLGKALSIFLNPDRIVVGLNDLSYQPLITELLQPFSTHIVWMSIVSAEMTKHAINSFLAVSVTFINELAALCETVGANARDVERALKSEERIGPNAYLRPGDAIAGGTLMRDVNYLINVGQEQQRDTQLLDAVLTSNLYHKKWVCRKMTSLFPNLTGKKIAVLGLTYKPGTDTLRRSTAIETCEWLHTQGVNVQAFDPAITLLPQEYAQFMQIQTSINATLDAADAVIIATAWPDFKNILADDLVKYLRHPRVLDPSGFIENTIGTDNRIHYFSVGVSA